jgi:hypothetical protein
MNAMATGREFGRKLHIPGLARRLLMYSVIEMMRTALIQWACMVKIRRSEGTSSPIANGTHTLHREGLPRRSGSRHAIRAAGAILEAMTGHVGVEGHLPGRGDGLTTLKCTVARIVMELALPSGPAYYHVVRRANSGAAWGFRESSGNCPAIAGTLILKRS